MSKILAEKGKKVKSKTNKNAQKKLAQGKESTAGNKIDYSDMPLILQKIYAGMSTY